MGGGCGFIIIDLASQIFALKLVLGSIIGVS